MDTIVDALVERTKREYKRAAELDEYAWFETQMCRREPLSEIERSNHEATVAVQTAMFGVVVEAAEERYTGHSFVSWTAEWLEMQRYGLDPTNRRSGFGVVFPLTLDVALHFDHLSDCPFDDLLFQLGFTDILIEHFGAHPTERQAIEAARVAHDSMNADGPTTTYWRPQDELTILSIEELGARDDFDPRQLQPCLLRFEVDSDQCPADTST